MKLWIIKAVEGNVRWNNPYDKNHGFVIRAETQADARWIASQQRGDEGGTAWLDPKDTTCEELTAEGEQGIVLRDFNAG